MSLQNVRQPGRLNIQTRKLCVTPSPEFCLCRVTAILYFTA